MTEGEQTILESIDMPYNKYWIPLVWSTSLVTRARKENRIKDDMAVKTIIDVCLLALFTCTILIGLEMCAFFSLIRAYVLYCRK